VTVVAIWFEPQDKGLWAAADTRISVPAPGGGVYVRTDSAAKLYSLSVVCRPIANSQELFPPPHWFGTFGFAFSGDALPALMTFATATSCLANLKSFTRTSPPTLRSVAEVVRRLGTLLGKETAASRNGSALQMEIAVFGWCPILERFAVYSLAPDVPADPLSLALKEALPATNEEITVLGSGGEEILERAARLREGGTEYRAPTWAVRGMINQGGTPEVGGSLTLGFANRFGFNHFAPMTPMPGGTSGILMTLNGIDIDQQIGPVGEYRISMIGMA
jgi:hypothetical protein